MANRWYLTAALAGAGAIGAAGLAIGTLVVDRHSAAALFTLQMGDEATKVAVAVTARAGQAMLAEVTSAAAVPPLRAALRNRVDAATLEDLFATEEWWAPYRERSAALIIGAGPLISHPVRQLMPDTEIAPRARTEGAVYAVKLSGGVPVLVGATVIDDAPGAPVLTLTRPLDAALVAEWARAAGTALAVADGQRVVAASDDAMGKLALAGHERDPVLPSDGRRVAAASALGGDLWLWVARPLPPAPDGALWIWGVVALAALLAVTLALIGKPKKPAPVSDADRTSVSLERPEMDLLDDGFGGDHGGRRHVVARGARVTMSGTPRKFGRYELVERIGEGGMSEIYTANMRGAKGFERFLVIKRLKRELAANPAAVEQFIDEARLGSQLTHPNIVQVYDFGEVDDGYFMALEYVPGRNVQQIVERHFERMGRGLDLSTVFYLVHDLLQALAYAHDRANANGEPLAIVHRDVSPANVIISTRGDVKLLDFGIVKAEGRLSRSDIANVKGNPAFMAPEQARGMAVDARSDLFSVGLVMYYALTGDMVYRGSNAGETLFHAATGPSREEMERILKLPEPAARLIERALAGEPEDRFQSAEEFAAAIAPGIRTSARVNMGTLLHALFGAEFRAEGISMVDRSTPVRPRAV